MQYIQENRRNSETHTAGHPWETRRPIQWYCKYVNNRRQLVFQTPGHWSPISVDNVRFSIFVGKWVDTLLTPLLSAFSFFALFVDALIVNHNSSCLRSSVQWLINLAPFSTGTWWTSAAWPPATMASSCPRPETKPQNSGSQTGISTYSTYSLHVPTSNI